MHRTAMGGGGCALNLGVPHPQNGLSETRNTAAGYDWVVLEVSLFKDVGSLMRRLLTSLNSTSPLGFVNILAAM